jgi:NitT/TauT family transport system permease protein
MALLATISGADEAVPNGRILRLVLLPVGFAAVTIALWQILCQTLQVRPILLPPPSAVWTVLRDNYGILLNETLPTLSESILGFIVASVLGVTIAVALTFSRWVHEALYPGIVMFQLIPKIALAPLFIVWLGVGQTTSVVVAVFIAFFPIVVSTATGLVSAKPEVLQLCKSLTASEWQVFRIVRFPYALPYIFAGMKVGVTMVMIGVVVGEFITAQHGLGYIIMFAAGAGETATVLAAIVLLCVIGLGLYGIIGLAELLVLRWLGGEAPIGGVI